MRRPSVLTIAGLDPGGGAGILADLRAFAAAEAFGCAVAAALTVQSTSGMLESHSVDTRLVRRQLDAVFLGQGVTVVKTGALGSLDNVRAVATWLGKHPRLPVVVDPVLLPTAGKGRLLAREALGALRAELLPRATLVTANAPEAEAIVERRVRSAKDACDAALLLVEMGAGAALVKGGHLRGQEAIDVLAIGECVIELRSRRRALPPLHGGGCVLASLVAGRLAVDDRGPLEARLLRAVRWARRVHQKALRSPLDVGGARRVLAP
jgi:hydroxymethylpyrimidine/phosphomethylpyrimidine kinase